MWTYASLFWYLRISNITPPSANKYDQSCHSTIADVVPTSDGLVFHLKWSKTRQHGVPVQQIPIPSLGNSPVCPVRAWQQYESEINHFGPPPNVPLLLSLLPTPGFVISAPAFRAQFRLLLQRANLGRFGYTPHSLRRGGASHSFQAGVPLQARKRHGTWVSNAVDLYLLSSPPFHTPVVRAFQRDLSV